MSNRPAHTHRRRPPFLWAGMLLAWAAVAVVDGGTPSHPAKIPYPALDWKVPLGTPYRATLSNGLKAYIAEDHSLPYVEITGYVRSAAFLDPAGKEGLGALAARLMRTGGTERFPADSLDRLLDLLAIRISVSLGETEMTFSLACLAEYRDTALSVLADVLFHPIFDSGKVAQETRLAVEAIRHRFDNPEPVLGASFEKSLYRGMPNARLSTEESVGSLTRADLRQYHERVFQTQNMFLAAAGDFKRAQLVAALERLFPAAPSILTATIENSITGASPVRCLFVHRPISQAYVRFGVPLFKRPHPDYYALSALNMVLGDDGFTSRLGSKIRSDEGLTYSIHSQVESNYAYPGAFFVSFHTKTESAARATFLALEEIDKIRREGVTDEELADAKRVLVDGLPSMFRSPGDIVKTYAWNEYFGRSERHYATYADSINALTKEDLARVAKKYLDSTKFVYAIVGDTAQVFRLDAVSGFSLRALAPAQATVPDSLPWLDQLRAAPPPPKADAASLPQPPTTAPGGNTPGKKN